VTRNVRERTRTESHHDRAQAMLDMDTLVKHGSVVSFQLARGWVKVTVERPGRADRIGLGSDLLTAYEVAMRPCETQSGDTTTTAENMPGGPRIFGTQAR
jgi:hypothetical protein